MWLERNNKILGHDIPSTLSKIKMTLPVLGGGLCGECGPRGVTLQGGGSLIFQSQPVFRPQDALCTQVWFQRKPVKVGDTMCSRISHRRLTMAASPEPLMQNQVFM
jgi:hypothetical protein